MTFAVMISAFPKYLNRKTPDTTEFRRVFKRLQSLPSIKKCLAGFHQRSVAVMNLESINPCCLFNPTVLQAESRTVKISKPNPSSTLETDPIRTGRGQPG
jgi:hypothetical protein